MKGCSIVAVCLCFLLTGSTSAIAGGQKKSDDSSSPSSSTGYPSAIAFGPQYYCDNTGISVERLVNEYVNWMSWGDLQQDLGRIADWCVGLTPTEQSPVAFTIVLGEHIYNVIYPQPDRYSQTLFGVTRTTAIIVADYGDLPNEPPGNFGFTFNKTRSPLEAQAPDFVKAIVGGLVPSSKAHLMGTVPMPAQGVALTLFVGGVSEFPSKRGTVVETGTVNLSMAGIGRLHLDPAAVKDGVASAVTYTDTPRQSFEFTALAGALVGAIHGPSKMKVGDNGMYASDPLSRTIGLAAVAFHPLKYDSTRPTITPQERLSVWLGGVLTAPGFGAGLSLGAVRGLTASIGYVWLWVPTSINGEAPKTLAPDGDQLAHKQNRAVFLGGGYVFGKGGS
jgi:hypothetical protein